MTNKLSESLNTYVLMTLHHILLFQCVRSRIFLPSLRQEYSQFRQAHLRLKGSRLLCHC